MSLVAAVLGVAAVLVLLWAVERRLFPTVTCRRCEGEGSARRWLWLRPCPRCGGKGEIDRRRR